MIVIADVAWSGCQIIPTKLKIAQKAMVAPSQYPIAVGELQQAFFTADMEVVYCPGAHIARRLALLLGIAERHLHRAKISMNTTRRSRNAIEIPEIPGINPWCFGNWRWDAKNFSPRPESDRCQEVIAHWSDCSLVQQKLVGEPGH
jgi:hypothetical protein